MYGMCYHGTEEWDEIVEMLLEEDPEEEFKEDRKECIETDEEQEKATVHADD